MTKLEKVINGLEHCTREVTDVFVNECSMCPYKPTNDDEKNCVDRTQKDALELLKAMTQYKWERDVAIAQLEKIGKSLGQTMDDIKEQQWISVKDRLPDNKSRYLCACFDYVTKTYWIDVLWHVSGSWWARLSTMGTDKDYNDHVRYWMPLPEPPKEGDSE